MYDIILHNNASKEDNIIMGVENKSENSLYLSFSIDLSSYPEGEYSYMIIYDSLSGVSYNLKAKTVSYDGKTFRISDLRPIVGLMRIGNAEEDKSAYNKDNNTIYYYRG